VLEVRGAAALLAAVRRCWASAFGARVAAYRAARKEDGVVAMAVLVQRLVPATASGVAFTANPVTGDRGETVVSAARGLGDRLVSDQVSPDEWLVRADAVVPRRDREGALNAAEARAVADLARRVEASFGSPQDIEWALAKGQLFLLQARPITALSGGTAESIPVGAEPPPGFWQREVSHYPRPLSPMYRALLEAFNASMKRATADFSLLVDGVEFREIGGWVYQRLVPLGGRDMPAPPAWLMPVFIRTVPRMRSRIRGAVHAVRSDKAGAYIRRWHADWKAELASAIACLRSVDLAALSDDELDRHLGQVIGFFRHSLDIHTRLNIAVLSALAEIAFVCRDLLGWDDRKTFELLSGLSETSSQPSRALAGLTRMAGTRPAVRALLDQIDDQTATRLAEVDREFAEALAAYQRAFGCRALGEITDPTLAESPRLILGLVRDQLRRGYDPVADAAALEARRAAAIAEARVAVATRADEGRTRFERALTRGEQAYPVREDNQFYAVSAPMALVRYAVLETGRRLADRRQLVWQGDVFFLEFEEGRAALREGGDQRPVVARRRAERAWVEAHPGPPSYGRDPGPPPSLAAFPPEARHLMDAMVWAMSRVFAAEHGHLRPPSESILHGIAASPGRYTGPVRVIMSEAEFPKLRPGDVLVCPMTSPVWSVLFPSVGALVTDAGGILSHPAIIAREYRVPAVVATGHATSLLHDSRTITVDGSAGVVEAQP
jgi:pyruvate,water dikinase